jgi:hypothetical protein
MNPTTLSDDLRESLVRASRTAIGDDLRSLVYFTADSFEQLYLRSDLERAARVDSFVENERRGVEERRAYGDTELGDYEFTVRAFSRGYVVRVMHGDCGAFATTDRMPISRFAEVATAMRKVLAGEPVAQT